MTIESRIADLTTATTELTNQVLSTKATAESLNTDTATLRDAAALSASSASASEVASASSQSAALLSEQASLASQQAAKTSETNAKQSEIAAASSASAALSSETAAKGSEIAASTSASEATLQAQASASSASDSLASENKAHLWATETVDVPVEVGEFSARHHAVKAGESAAAALASQTAAATSESNAATSEANAAQSASTASSSVSAHENSSNPHPQYTTESEAAAAAPVQSVQGETGDVDLSNYFEPRRSANMVWNPVSDSYARDRVNTGVTPIHEKMRRCVQRDDGTVAYYLDPNDSTLKADGSPANLDGTDGQVMVEIPKCYVRISKLFNGEVKREISEYPRSGFVLHPAFVKAGTGWQYDPEVQMWHCTKITEEREATYVGAYQASVYDTTASQYIDGLNLDNNDSRVDYTSDILASVSGRYPMVGVTRAQMRQLASNRGAGWHQWTFWQWNLIKLLFFVEYGGFDGQALLAAGNSSVSSGYPSSSINQSDSPHSAAGKSNIIGNGSGGVGSSTRDTAWMSYRGIENFWGNAWQFVDGFNVNDWIWYISNDPATFADDTTTGYNQLGEAAPSSNGYIRNVQHETLGDVPSDTSGNSTTAFADYYWQNPGWRMALVGGHAADGAIDGPSCVTVSVGSGSRYRSFAGRLAFSGKP